VSADAAREPSVDPALVEGFYSRGTRRPPCLLIHGFTGTPYEMRGLGDHLHARGHSVLGVRLAGHARSLEELEGARWEDWYAAVVEGCDRLTVDDGPLVAIGLSAGAVLALHLAHERGHDVGGLVLMATAVALSSWHSRWTVPLIARLPWIRDRFRFIAKAAGSDIEDAAARRIHPSHRFVPLRGVASLLELQRRVRAECGAIRQPTLLIHGAHDHTCPPENTRWLAEHLGAPPRRVVVLPESAHIVTVDVEHERVMTEVAEFVETLAISQSG
jgi:carboxylesterase